MANINDTVDRKDRECVSFDGWVAGVGKLPGFLKVGTQLSYKQACTVFCKSFDNQVFLKTGKSQIHYVLLL